MLLHLHIEGIAPDPIYPYGSFDEAPSQPEIIVTPDEEMLPRRPPTPFAHAVPSTEGTPYIPSTPSEGRPGPPPGQGIPAAIYTDDLGPRVMDYTAGRSGAPDRKPAISRIRPSPMLLLPGRPARGLGLRRAAQEVQTSASVRRPVATPRLRQALPVRSRAPTMGEQAGSSATYHLRRTLRPPVAGRQRQH